MKFLEKITGAVLNLVDDVQDARDQYLVKLHLDIRKAFTLSMIEVGQALIEEGEHRIQAFYGGGREHYETPSLTKICGARGPVGNCVLPPGHSNDHWDRIGTWTRGLCPLAHNSSDKGWQYCNREIGHPGLHNTVDGVEWETPALQEQGDVISVEYDS